MDVIFCINGCGFLKWVNVFNVFKQNLIKGIYPANLEVNYLKEVRVIFQPSLHHNKIMNA